MPVLWAEAALLPDGFADAVRLEIDETGDLPDVRVGASRRAPSASPASSCPACRTCTATRSSGPWQGSPSASSR